MAAINITEKGVEVQVNGTSQATYDQRANDATYDVSASADAVQSFNWTVDVDYDYNNLSTGVFLTGTTNAPTPALVHYVITVTDGEVKLRTDTDQDGNFDNSPLLVENSDSIGSETRTLTQYQTYGSFDYEWACSQAPPSGSVKIIYADNVTQISPQYGPSRIIPTGANLSVNGVTQS
jgi:hypothetical protein